MNTYSSGFSLLLRSVRPKGYGHPHGEHLIQSFTDLRKMQEIHKVYQKHDVIVVLILPAIYLV